VRRLSRFSFFSRISHFRTFHAFHVSDTSRFRASHILRAFCDPTQFAFCALAYLACFAFLCILHILHFAFLHSCVFCALTHATAHLPRIRHIPFACPVLILQGPLVHISLCFIRITSYMSLHFHLCSLISLCVYITSPLYV